MIWVMLFTIMLNNSPVSFTVEFDTFEACKAASIWVVKLPGYHTADCELKDLREPRQL